MRKINIDFQVKGNVKICTLDNEMAIALFKQRIHEALVEFDCDKLSIDINVINTDIMDTSNGHNPSLVDAINKAYNCQTERFEDILRLLVSRDHDDIDPEDIDMLEDLLLASLNEAMRKADEKMESEMGKLTGGLNIPGMF